MPAGWPGSGPAAAGASAAPPPRLPNHPARGPVPPLAHHLIHPLLGHGVVVGHGRLGRHRLPAQPGQTALLQLPHHPFHLPLGLGPVGPAGLGHHPQHRRQVHPIGGQDRLPVTGLAHAERRIPVGQHLPRRSPKVLQAPAELLQGRRPGQVRGEPKRRLAAVPQDRHHPVQLHQPLSQRPEPQMGPVRLHRPPRGRLEPDLRVRHPRWPQHPQVPGEPRVAAPVPVALAELLVQHRSPDPWAHQEPPLHVRQLRLRQSRRLGPLRIPSRLLAIHLPFHRPPVQMELPRQRRQAPAMGSQDSQTHPNFLTLQRGPPQTWTRHPKPVRGPFSSVHRQGSAPATEPLHFW